MGKDERIEFLEGELEKLRGRVLVGDFLMGLVHEVKNQLVSISLLEILMDRLDEEGRGYVEQVLWGRDRILKLLNGVRFLGLEGYNGGGNFLMEEGNIGSVVEEGVDLAKLNEVVKRNRVEVEVHDSGGAVFNRDRIIQVVVNLVVNAAESMVIGGRGGIRVIVKREGYGKKVEVIDDGVGVLEEDMGKVWERFFTTKGDGNSGLGLDIVKKIIEEHGGEVGCQRRVMGGSIFYFTLRERI